MERSVGSKSSPGSDHFNDKAAIKPTKIECLDFISFDMSPPNKTQQPQNKGMFSPPNFSSPVSQRSPRYGNNNRSWHGNNRNFNAGHQSNMRSPFNKNNSWQGNSGYKGNNFKRNINQQFNHADKNTSNFDASLYLHSSFTENPWARLEKEYREKLHQEAAMATATSCS